MDRESLLDLCQCYQCPLLGVRNPVLGVGNGSSGIAIVGEAPGRNEAERGVPFIGQAGKLLDATLAEVGVDRVDTFMTNTVLCRPTNNEGGDAAPPAAAIHACRPRLIAELREAKPSIVVAMGNTACSSVLETKEKVSTLIGSTHWRDEVNAFVIPVYHPAAVLHGATGLFDDILAVMRRAARLASGKTPFPQKRENIQYQYTDDPKVAQSYLETLLADPGPYAIDVETDDLRFLEHPLLLVSMSSMQHNFVFDAPALGKDPAYPLFIAMLEDQEITWVLHNLRFDFQFLRYHYGSVPTTAIDTMAMALGVTERGEAVGLKRLSREWLNAPYYEEAVHKYMVGKQFKMSNIPRPLLIEYAAADTHYTVRMPAVLGPLIDEEGTRKLVFEVLIPGQRLFADMEYTGALVDTDYARSLEAAWLPRTEEIIVKLQKLAADRGFDAYTVSKAPKGGSALNPRSSKQLLHFFYDILGYEAPVTDTSYKHGALRRAEAKRTTNGDFIYAHPGDEPIELLKTLRQLDKVLRTYVYGIMDDVWLDDRVHPDFKIYGAVTGRISITNPPLQTIPHWGIARLGVHATEELATQLRNIFIASPGYVFVEADYSQLELRVAWHYSRDPLLGEAIMSGDFHSRTAAAVLHKPLSEVTKSDRFISKFVTFGVMYGRQAKSLATGELKCSVQQAQLYIDQFWAAYPKYKRWWEGIRTFVLENGYARSTLGRKRRWSLFTKETTETILNQAVNMPVQALASDLCLTSAIRINNIMKRTKWGRPLFLVHDSIVFEIKREHLDEALRMIKREMTTPTFKTCASFEVEFSVGRSWGDSRVYEPEEE